MTLGHFSLFNEREDFLDLTLHNCNLLHVLLESSNNYVVYSHFFISPTSCLGECPPGTSSVDGYEPCTPCPIGTYQGNSSATVCIQCRYEQSTPSEGSKSEDDCG